MMLIKELILLLYRLRHAILRYIYSITGDIENGAAKIMPVYCLLKINKLANDDV